MQVEPYAILDVVITQEEVYTRENELVDSIITDFFKKLSERPTTKDLSGFKINDVLNLRLREPKLLSISDSNAEYEIFKRNYHLVGGRILEKIFIRLCEGVIFNDLEVTKEQADVIIEKAWETYTSSDYNSFREIILEFEDLIELFSAFLNCKQEH